MLVSKKLRHLEYYDLQRTFDELYEKSQKGHKFSNLFEIIASDENIKLAYRNIKRNKGSKTAGVDGLTIKNVKKLSEEKFLEIIKKKLAWYSPKAVKRVEIPKLDGRKRPLGIPTIMDRIVQQCILQVLEPICEAKFHERSNGFRPNRSAEHAIAQCYKMIQQQNLHFAVDIDIKGFFDNVDHAKLIKQMWNMGICDKKLLCIVKEMLKAPIVLPIGEKYTRLRELRKAEYYRHFFQILCLMSLIGGLPLNGRIYQLEQSTNVSPTKMGASTKVPFTYRLEKTT